ncbi:MAG: hypothetical protein AAFV07_02415 [Bacteroidota bacterium]
MKTEQQRETRNESKAAASTEEHGASMVSVGRTLAPPPLPFGGPAQRKTAVNSRSAQVIQRWRQPSANTRPVSFTVPRVRPIRRVSDPVRRNNHINRSYHEFGRVMSEYLGSPLLANWCTYGQHASREAGAQIRNLSEGLNILRQDLPAIINPITLATFITDPGNAPPFRALRRMKGLLDQPGMVGQAFQLAFQKAGVSTAQINTIVAEALAIARLNPANPIHFAEMNARAIVLLARLAVLAAQLAIAIPEIISTLDHILQNMIQGNRGIYESIAPAYHTFLTAAKAHPQGLPQNVRFRGDSSGFLEAAFELYAEGKFLADEFQATGNRDLLTERQNKIHRANLLIGFQEQLVILQPIFDTMQEELRAMSGSMVLRDPSGTHNLIGNWGDFYTRMGIDPATAPRDPRTIRPDNLPPMHGRGHRMRSGTINEYFEDNITNRATHQAPPNLSRF